MQSTTTRRLTCLIILTSTPPPNARAAPVRECWSEKAKAALSVLKSVVTWATPASACANGVARVWLRSLNSGPNNRLEARDRNVYAWRFELNVLWPSFVLEVGREIHLQSYIALEVARDGYVEPIRTAISRAEQRRDVGGADRVEPVQIDGAGPGESGKAFVCGPACIGGLSACVASEHGCQERESSDVSVRHCVRPSN